MRKLTKAEWMREIAIVRRQLDDTLKDAEQSAMDAVAAIEQRDEWRGLAERLHSALRELAIDAPNPLASCGLCRNYWNHDGPESHDDGCLAALWEAKP